MNDYQQALENAALAAKVAMGVRQLAEENTRLRAMLKRLEQVTFSSYTFCPACRKLTAAGHAPDCELAALLKEADK